VALLDVAGGVPPSSERLSSRSWSFSSAERILLLLL
jgi:hypothetical protein